MKRMFLGNRWAWLAAGVLGGMLLAGFWPHAPLHAVATDRTDTFAIATGMLDNDIEALVMLDFLTGNLKGRALGTQTGRFQAYYEGNVMPALNTIMQQFNAGIQATNRERQRKNLPPLNEIVAPEKPRFLLVTGGANLRRGPTGVRPGLSVVYVVETTTGIVLVYGMPWSPEIVNRGRAYQGQFQLLDSECFRS